MAEADPFPGWLAEVAADAVVVRPDDQLAEARGNHWGFGLSAEQRAVVTPAGVEGFVRSVAAARALSSMNSVRVLFSASAARPMSLRSLAPIRRLRADEAVMIVTPMYGHCIYTGRDSK